MAFESDEGEVVRKPLIAVFVTASVLAPSIVGTWPARGAPPARAWIGERQISPAGSDSWEPEVAGDPSSSYVYVAYRWHNGPRACSRCPNPPIVVQSSSDAGRTWAAPVFVCACPGVQGQFDPVIQVTSTGTVYATWMNWYDTVFSKSTDHGQTWSSPVEVSGARWTDHPWFGSSADGRDIYVFWAQGDVFEAHSHDFGATWSVPRKINTDRQRYYYPEGVAVLPDGTVLLAAAAYPCGKGTSVCSGAINISVFRSTDGGASFTEQNVDTVSSGVDFATSALATLASDAAGRTLLIYTGAPSVGANSQLFIRHTIDGGITWSTPREIGSGPAANAAFPAIAAGASGSFHAIYVDNRTGAWNTWYRSSTDGGLTWTADMRISEATAGAPYKSEAGYANPYGDYMGVDVTGQGEAVAAWGEAPSWSGPGDIWVNSWA